ncbi:hypothetical protein C6496_19590 [Candidatus Poribacteria bacterium]|nr:MAG: hypothetical protein C6496_19590 [Candidatus Poribacteria bacterium]
MKEQPVEVGRSAVDYSIGQRPIHDTYEPPNPIPQFRPRPKIHQAQPSIKRPAYSTITQRLTKEGMPEAAAKPQTAVSKKSN